MNHLEAGKYWNENAHAWTQLARAGYDVYRDHLNTPAFFAMLPDVRGLAGLDIGCGEGHNTRLLAQRGARVTAVDVAENFIRYAKGHGGRSSRDAELDPNGIPRAGSQELAPPAPIRYAVARAVSLPFADATFDFAIERVEEPTASDEVVARQRDMQDTQMMPYFLHVRGRKK
jgi:ubiquinone/menaquinone biosynthesis C-methylase UbiE